jgi:hypothetical protein
MVNNALSAPGAPSRMRGQAFDYTASSPVRQPDFFEQGFVPGAPPRIRTPPQISDSASGVKRKLFQDENQDGSVTPPAKKPSTSPPPLPKRW